MQKIDYKNTQEGRLTARKYADIINASRPDPVKPHMDLVQRAKIFSPYDALRGFDEAIDAVIEKTEEVPREELSEEEKEKLSEKLLRIHKNMPLTVQYFVPGSSADIGNYVTLKGRVISVDPIHNDLQIEPDAQVPNDGGFEKELPVTIKFNDLLNIDIPEGKEE